MDRVEAADHLARRYGCDARPGGVYRAAGPGVEAVAEALQAHRDYPSTGGVPSWLKNLGHELRTIAEGTTPAVPEPTVEDLRAAIALLPGYLADVEAIQREVIAAARKRDPKTGKYPLTWSEIGQLLGFPPNTAKQRAVQLGTKLGVLTKEPTRPREDRGADDRSGEAR